MHIKRFTCVKDTEDKVDQNDDTSENKVNQNVKVNYETRDVSEDSESVDKLNDPFQRVSPGQSVLHGTVS